MAQTSYWSGKGNVVSLNRFRSGKTLSPLHQAEAYWSALRRDGDVPSRSRIDPRGLEPVLGHAFVLEQIAPGLARFRLAGQHVNDIAGMEVRGMPLSALFAARYRTEIASALRDLFETPSVINLTLKATGNGEAVEARMLLLPLKCDMGDVSRALGVMLADTSKVDTPRRFDLVNLDARPVSGRRDSAHHTDLQSRFEDARAELDGQARYLRVVPPGNG